MFQFKSVSAAAKRLKILLGLLQQAHYDPLVFGSWLFRHPRPQDWDEFQARVQLIWSTKARLLFWLAWSLSFFSSKLLAKALLASQKIIRPLEWILVQYLCFLAHQILRQSNIKNIVGITGSYAKTTTKEFLKAVLASRYRVQAPPENINTLLGVSRWILKNHRAFASCDILIVEMGAYRQGDIRQLAKLIKPNIGILTDINEAHLERFGNIETTKSAKCELFDSLPLGLGKALWNQDSPLLQEVVRERKTKWQDRGLNLIPYGAKGTTAIQLKVTEHSETSLDILAERIVSPTWSFRVGIRLFGWHHASVLALAIAVGDLLGLRPDEISQGLRAIQPIPRRMATSYSPTGSLIVDDSYNITLDGVRAAMAALSHIHRRKLGVFAGIPEAGALSQEINRELGRMIAPVFDILLLRKTPVESEIVSSLRDAGWKEENLIRYTEANEVEKLLIQILKPRDCVYFSAYDWPAIYL